jgi:antitoxin component YwqK of YwqJK toxin-antitoxin module
MKELINQHDLEGRPHGLWEDYWRNGTLWYRGHWHHGRRHGVWERYHSDGTLWWEEKWHHGVRKGLATLWDFQGRIDSKKYHLVIR